MDWLKRVLDQATVAFRAMTAAQRASMVMLGLTIVVALGLVVVLGARPKFVVMASGLEKDEMAEAVRMLDEAGEEYKVDQAKGAILVHADRKPAWVARFVKVVPREKIYDYERYLTEGSGFQYSDAQRKEMRRIAQGGELQKTIGSFEGVERCKVEIKPESEGEYVLNPEKVGVSVFLTMRRGQTLDSQMANSIIDVVNSAVRNSDPKLITVVDTRNPRVTFRKEDPDTEVFIGKNQLNLRKEVERFYRQKLEDFISQTGYECAVTVNAIMDIKKLREVIRKRDQDGRGGVLLWQEKRKTESVGATGPGGPVGVPENPPGGTMAGGTGSSGGGTPSTMKDDSNKIQMDYDAFFQEITKSSSDIMQLSASVVITERRVTRKDEKTGRMVAAYVAPSDQEKADWKRMIVTALGVKPDDQAPDKLDKLVTICHMKPSQSEPPDPFYEPPPSVMARVTGYAPYARVAGVLLLACAALFFLYSLGRRAAVAPPAEVVVAGGPEPAEGLGEGEAVEPEEIKFKQMQERIANLVDQDPRKVSSLVKRWLSRES